MSVLAWPMYTGDLYMLAVVSAAKGTNSGCNW